MNPDGSGPLTVYLLAARGCLSGVMPYNVCGEHYKASKLTKKNKIIS
jgi:hypothetical protein